MKCDTHKPACNVAKVIGGIILGIGAAFLFGLFIKLLWNGLMPKIFGLGLITYWQAVGLAILGRLILGGFGSSGGGSSKNKHHHHDYGYHGHHHGDHGHHSYHGRYGKHDSENCCAESMKKWEAYDEWWSSEGEASFKKFANEKISDNDKETNDD